MITVVPAPTIVTVDPATVATVGSAMEKVKVPEPLDVGESTKSPSPKTLFSSLNVIVARLVLQLPHIG